MRRDVYVDKDGREYVLAPGWSLCLDTTCWVPLTTAPSGLKDFCTSKSRWRRSYDGLSVCDQHAMENGAFVEVNKVDQEAKSAGDLGEETAREPEKPGPMDKTKLGNRVVDMEDT